MDPADIINGLAQLIADKISTTGIVKPRLLTVEQTAVYLGRTDNAVRSLMASGAVKAVKLDGRVQFDVRDLDVWIENSKY
jgi:hypothetical protein